MATDPLNDAIALMKAGRKAEAHQILRSLIAANPHNVPAWLWDAGTSPTMDGRIQVMELCLQQNPGNNQVIEALTGLKTQLAKDALLVPQPTVVQPTVAPTQPAAPMVVATLPPTAVSGPTAAPVVEPTLPPATVAPTNPPRPAGNCDPSYPTVCIPPPPPDLNCKDIPYKNFQVLPPDPHHFDADKDGIGCEK